MPVDNIVHEPGARRAHRRGGLAGEAYPTGCRADENVAGRRDFQMRAESERIRFAAGQELPGSTHGVGDGSAGPRARLPDAAHGVGDGRAQPLTRSPDVPRSDGR